MQIAQDRNQRFDHLRMDFLNRLDLIRAFAGLLSRAIPRITGHAIASLRVLSGPPVVAAAANMWMTCRDFRSMMQVQIEVKHGVSLMQSNVSGHDPSRPVEMPDSPQKCFSLERD